VSRASCSAQGSGLRTRCRLAWYGASGNSQVSVSWDVPANNGGSPITSYIVTASPGGQTCTWSSGPLTCTVDGLTNGIAYTLTVVAINANGPGPPSAPSAPVRPRDRWP